MVVEYGMFFMSSLVQLNTRYYEVGGDKLEREAEYSLRKGYTG